MRPPSPFARHPLLIAAALLALGACDRAAKPPAAVAPAPEPTKQAAPQPPSVVDRAELLRALDTAASAFAAGQAIDSASLDGHRFAIRSAFGCAGPAAQGAASPVGTPRAVWGRRRQTIELTLQPADWTTELASNAGDTAEAVEGLWLERPWMRTDGCPASPTPAPSAPAEADTASQPTPPRAAETTAPPPPAPPRQTAGLASVFAQGASRVGRRDGRAFTHTVRGDDEPPKPPSAGYRLVVEGRFTAFPGGGTIRCRADGGAENRPTCLAASTIDRVVFETAMGEMLSEWRPG